MNKKDEMNNASQEPRQTSLIWLIILATILGLSGGVAGVFITKSYLLTSSFPSLSKDINISQDSLRRASLIIENAKKIVIEQDNKVSETVASSRNSIVGIFKKKEAAAIATSTGEKTFSIADYYRLDEEAGEGLIVTSDGWIIGAELPKGLANEAIIKNYVVVTKNKNVYEIDQVIKTDIEPYLFLHLARAKDLPVKGLAASESITESQLLVAVNWQGKSYLSSLFEKEKINALIKDSDVPNGRMILSDSLNNFFGNAFIFSLNGEAAALYNQKSGVVAIDNFLPIIKGLLEKKELKYASLGVYYVNLSSLTIKDPRYERGAMIYPDGKKAAVKPGSAASKAGLKEGDIILSVDSIQINADNDLAQAIRKYSSGEEINIIYLRNGQENMAKIKLQELEPASGQKL